MQWVSLEDLLRDGKTLFDVRSPGEYHQGHIPFALNLPLLSDTERAEIGTLYKRKGRQAAVLRGLDFFGPKMRSMAETARIHARDGSVALYCWRGGMRSSGVGWLLSTAGFQTCVLQGGYKTYRRWALNQFALPRRFFVVGGSTGNGKTWILHALREMGEQVIDFEGLAGHRGSSYGCLGLPPQPSQEQFENKIAYFLHSFDDRPIWVEDESRMIGSCKIPDELFAQISAAPLFHINRPKAERIHHLLSEYGSNPREDLILATKRISKRLGHEATAKAVQFVEEGNIAGMIEIIINYYDRAYDLAIKKRTGPVHKLVGEGHSLGEWAEHCFRHSKQLLQKNPILV